MNLTNQLVGEVQLFIFTMRWVMYEFYQFKALRKEDLLVAGDFEALEDDLVFIIHKIVMKDQVLNSMVVLNRVYKNKADKDIRKKYKLVSDHQSVYFPIEQGSSDTNFKTMTPALIEILDMCKKSKEMPFKKAVIEFQAIMGSSNLSPLDKLYKLQYLSVTDHFQNQREFFQRFGPLTRDEKLPIMQFIIIKAGIPDLVSQFDLISAFSTVYMQQSEDGCLLSETYLNLEASIKVISTMDNFGLSEPNYYIGMACTDVSRQSSLNDSHEVQQSFLGLNNILN